MGDKNELTELKLNMFGRGIMKILGWLGLTSGVGLMLVGGVYIGWGLANFVWSLVFGLDPQTYITEAVAMLYLIVAILGLLVVGVAIMIRELKELKVK